MTRLSTEFAFTLAELLIALAILGVIATFTIPKILDSGSSSEFNTKAKETAGMISEALQIHKLNGQLSSSTISADLTQYMNYVRAETAGGLIDHYHTATFQACSASAQQPCLKVL